jgi:RNase P subunit RPR2
MDWNYVDEILRDGTLEEIIKVRCPECGSAVRYQYTRFDDDDSADLSIYCDNCGAVLRGQFFPGDEIPVCVEYFGNEARIDENLKELQIA